MQPQRSRTVTNAAGLFYPSHWPDPHPPSSNPLPPMSRQNLENKEPGKFIPAKVLQTKDLNIKILHSKDLHESSFAARNSFRVAAGR